MNCAVGKSSSAGASACTDCASGTTNTVAGGSCSACAAGKYWTSTTVRECLGTKRTLTVVVCTRPYVCGCLSHLYVLLIVCVCVRVCGHLVGRSALRALSDSTKATQGRLGVSPALPALGQRRPGSPRAPIVLVCIQSVTVFRRENGAVLVLLSLPAHHLPPRCPLVGQPKSCSCAC